MRNIKYLFPLAMAAMVACKQEPTPIPEPPKPVKPTEKIYDIKTISDLNAMQSVDMNVKNTNFTANWANVLALTPDQTGTVGAVKDLDTSKSNFKMNDNGYGISFGAGVVLTFDQWAASHYHDIVAGSDGGKPTVPWDQYDQFISRGETDVIKGNEPEKPTEFVTIPAADSVNFSAAIAKIIADNSGKAVNLCFPHDVTIKNGATLKNLSTKHIINPGAKVFIVDKDGNPDDLDVIRFHLTEWTELVARFCRASGVVPELVQDNPNVPVPIIIPEAAEHTITLKVPNGTSDFAVVELNQKFLPMENNPQRAVWFTINARKTVFYVPSQSELKLRTESGYDDMSARSANSNDVRQFLSSRGITFSEMFDGGDWYLSYGETDVWMRYCMYYDPTTWSADSRTTGKRPYDAADFYIEQKQRGNGVYDHHSRATNQTRAIAKYNRMQNTR